MKTEKIIMPTGKMSNLVNMWALIWQDDKLKNIVFVLGKADDSNYIVQGINALTGEPNICKIVSIEQMKDWTFCPTIELVNEVREDWHERGVNRYKLNI